MNQVVKFIVGRERPFVHALPEADKPNTAHPSDNNVSFYSGHATMAFAMAVSGGTVASMRALPAGARGSGARGLALAAATAYLRIAADRHYASDVTTGAVVGSLTGFAVPYLFHNPATPDRRARADRSRRRRAGPARHVLSAVRLVLTSASGRNQISERARRSAARGATFARDGRAAGVARLLPWSQPAMKPPRSWCSRCSAAAATRRRAIEPVPAAFVNDACGGHATQEACAAGAGCEWRAVKSMPAGRPVRRRLRDARSVRQLADRGAAKPTRAARGRGCRLGVGVDRSVPRRPELRRGRLLSRARRLGRRLHLRAADRLSRERRLPGGRMRLLEPAARRRAAAAPAPAPARPARPARPVRRARATAAAAAVLRRRRAAAAPAPARVPACAPGASCPPCDCACGAGNVGVSGSATTVADDDGRRRGADRPGSLRGARRRRRPAPPTARARAAGSSSASSASRRRARAARVFR